MTTNSRSSSSKYLSVEQMQINAAFKIVYANQCDQIWRNLTTFGKSLKAFGNFMKINFVLGKIMYLLLQFFNTLGQMFIGEKCRIFKE